jgi:putative ABC transport system permease protein
MSAYMDLGAVHRLLREGAVATGALLATDPNAQDELYRRLKATPRVANVAIKAAAIHSFRQTVAENLLRMRLFNIVFASVIAFGVVYNSARIALAERGRDLATLRVLGFTRAEVARILLGELALLTAVAVPVGLLLGYALAYLVIQLAYDTELFRLPLVVSRWTYGFAVVITVTAAAGSALVVGRRLARLDIVAVLKSRE